MAVPVRMVGRGRPVRLFERVAAAQARLGTRRGERLGVGVVGHGVDVGRLAARAVSSILRPGTSTGAHGLIVGFCPSQATQGEQRQRMLVLVIA